MRAKSFDKCYRRHLSARRHHLRKHTVAQHIMVHEDGDGMYAGDSDDCLSRGAVQFA